MRILIAIALLLATTATARAQTCIGKTFSPGSIAVGVRGSVGDSFSSLGGGLAGYYTSGIFWDLGAGYSNPYSVENPVYALAGSVGYEVIRSGNISVCPAVTGGYSWWSRTIQSYEESITTLSGSVGAGVGLEVPTGAGPVLGFFVWPALLYHTYDYTFDGSETTYEESESDTHASLSFGAGFGIGRFFLSGAAEVTEDQKPEYGVQIGVRIW